jgi:glycosyltransferase involved in cell wall biosynthesis
VKKLVDGEIWIAVDETDSQFVREEVMYYAERYRQVVLISKKPLNLRGLEHERLKALVLQPQRKMTDYFHPFVWMIWFADLFSKGTTLNYWHRARYNLALFLSSVAYSRTLSPHIKAARGKNVRLLSYWFAEWALTFAWMKSNGVISGFYSRAHGRDLFEDREPLTGKLPFRRFMIRHCDGIFSVSEAGSRYLKKRYPRFKDKFRALYLGTRDHGTGIFDASGKFTVVTCARVRDIKRIHLVPHILKHMKTPVRWVHFGDENLDAKNETCIPEYKAGKKMLEDCPHVEAHYKGYVSNDEIQAYYRSNSVNLFLNVSSTEGLPFVLIEAAAMGIPLMATDVGGCAEIVNPATGILIPAGFDPSETANRIDWFASSEMNTPAFRSGVRRFWEQNFRADLNYEEFIAKVTKEAV